MQNNDIQTQPSPDCPVCGWRGIPLYRELTDSVFNVPGKWNIKRCNQPECKTLWLDPMPAEVELIKLYTSYFTHQTPLISRSRIRWQTLFDRIRASYLHDRYGYAPLYHSWIDQFLGIVAHLYPVLKDSIEASVFFLKSNPGGGLLEIGCGSGESLDLMQRLGWDVTGLDFDDCAVANARSKGLNVHHGELRAQRFADESFDAVVMSHVIEHVQTPGKLLEECWRVLRKGGVFVARTPNADSRLHVRYGLYWRGLEPPRHLQIFSSRSLAKLAKRTGFVDVNTFTTMNGFVYFDLASKELAANRRHDMGEPVALGRRILSHIKAIGYGWCSALLPMRNGEEVALVCRK